VTELQDQIGRALVVGIRGADPESAALRDDLRACEEANVGGAVLFDRDPPTGGDRNIVSPAQVRELIACLRERLGDDLLIMIDQEGGRVARLRQERGFDQGVSARDFAAMDEPQQREFSNRQAAQLAGLGININLAPVVDLDLNAGSEVIAQLGRSYGADPARVIACARIWIEEHRRCGVASCLKHYPGHGSAAGDTHQGMVDLTGRASRESELSPFQALATEPGVLVMTGHLIDRAIDPDLPASLSRSHTEGGLRRGAGFGGLIVTDSIDMGAITERWSPSEAAALAFEAGADLVMDGVNAAGSTRGSPAIEMRDSIEQAIRDGVIPDGHRRLRELSQRLATLLASIRRPCR